MRCPYQESHLIPNTSSELCHYVIKSGFFFRQSDKKILQRYRCIDCQRSFSTETTHPCKYQKKRELNYPLYLQFVSGVSQRRLARLHGINQKTVVRKFRLLGDMALSALNRKAHLKDKQVKCLIFDDMETFEHSKCKPLSITLAVENQSRFILGFRVSVMPAKGLLAQISRKRYGTRPDERPAAREDLLREIHSVTVSSGLVIKSDKESSYGRIVRKLYPQAQHITYKGRKACVVGQGELKAGGFDPIFSLNHTAAMIRANLNRLFRRTWNTTKKKAELEKHVALYVWYHNYHLII